MKCIFCVNNLISYLAALAVISKEKIPDNEYVIYSVNSKQYSPVKCIVLETKGGRIKQLFNRNATRRAIGRSVANSPFKLYISSMSIFAKCFATNPNCTSISFIEEGLGCYVNEYPMIYITDNYEPIQNLQNKTIYDKLKEILYILSGDSIKEAKIPYWYQAYIGVQNIKFYGFSMHTYYFAEADKKILLSFSDIINRFDMGYINHYNLDDSCILLGEAHLEIQGIYLNDYIKCIEQYFIPETKKYIDKTIFVKFHPDETEESKVRTKEILLKNCVKFNIIPDSISLEILLLEAKRAVLFGFDSSLLLYASMMGQESYSLSLHLKRSISCPYFLEMVKSK